MSAVVSISELTFRIHHMMLPVADLDRSIDFYTRLLGMKLKERHANESRGVAVALLGYSDDHRGPFLELTQNIGSNTSEAVTPLNAHIAVDVSDLHKLAGLLEAESVRFIRALKTRSDGKGLSAWITDPDGNPIELAERYT